MTDPDPNVSSLPRHRARHHRPELQRVPASRCFAWLAAGWRLFAAHPAGWVLIALCAFAMLAIPTMVLAPVPLIGPMIPPILLTLLLAGMLDAADAQVRHGRIRFVRLFEGFRRHPGNLMLVGLFYAIPLILVHLLLMVIGGGLLVGMLGGAITALTNAILSMLVDLGIALGIFLLLWGLLLLAMLFAPALIMLASAPPLEAMHLSLTASLHNLGAVLLLAILLYVLFALALLPAGLGIVIYLPVLVGTLHAAYHDMFSARPDEDA